MSLYDLELEPPFSDVITDDELASLNIKDLNRYISNNRNFSVLACFVRS
jgi:hypothetical protein